MLQNLQRTTAALSLDRRTHPVHEFRVGRTRAKRCFQIAFHIVVQADPEKAVGCQTQP